MRIISHVNCALTEAINDQYSLLGSRNNGNEPDREREREKRMKDSERVVMSLMIEA